MTEIERAKAEAVTEFAARLQNFYKHLSGKTASGMVVYHIEQVKKEFIGGLNNEK